MKTSHIFARPANGCSIYTTKPQAAFYCTLVIADSERSVDSVTLILHSARPKCAIYYSVFTMHDVSVQHRTAFWTLVL